ncbi:TetR/AcrR family transcriptional regulator [Isoptericola sp. AK164]|uniref:TetR/AcrR family transcriptional regulator n=1 Tax=Isoptericola sp. AK164 TaxID=3024246 RepID=UPI002418972B|nr:TetR/AcrR family transcriptional regulator [Isoptericola sp. AK164]
MERAALALALEHGLDQVTVEMICEAAEVSPRTFYNYFGTKEAVLLGPAPAPPAPSLLEEFLHAEGPLFEDVVAVLVAAFLAATHDAELMTLRRRLFDREPRLQALQHARWAPQRQVLTDHVVRRLAVQQPDLSPDAARDEARVVMGVATSTYPILSRLWLEGGEGAPDPHRYVAAAVDGVRRAVTARR